MQPAKGIVSLFLIKIFINNEKTNELIKSTQKVIFGKQNDKAKNKNISPIPMLSFRNPFFKMNLE